MNTSSSNKNNQDDQTNTNGNTNNVNDIDTTITSSKRNSSTNNDSKIENKEDKGSSIQNQINEKEERNIEESDGYSDGGMNDNVVVMNVNIIPEDDDETDLMDEMEIETEATDASTNTTTCTDEHDNSKGPNHLLLSNNSKDVSHSTRLMNMIYDETIRQLELAWEAQQSLALLCNDLHQNEKTKK